MGKTPLMRAAQNGHESVIKLLLRNGADTAISDIVSLVSAMFKWQISFSKMQSG